MQGRARTTVSEIDQFNQMPEARARTELEACLAVPRWVDELLSGRPYSTVDELLRAADRAAARLSTAEIEAALARHPRIGERAGAGHDGAFSSAEQAGVDSDDIAVAAALAAGNAEYESTFDRVFLIRAAGRSSDEILAELKRRLHNSPEAETAEVVEQLGEIARLRLEQVVGR